MKDEFIQQCVEMVHKLLNPLGAYCREHVNLDRNPLSWWTTCRQLDYLGPAFLLWFVLRDGLFTVLNEEIVQGFPQQILNTHIGMESDFFQLPGNGRIKKAGDHLLALSGGACGDGLDRWWVFRRSFPHYA